MPKSAQNKHAITGQSQQTNKHFVLKLISLTVDKYKSTSGQLKNNTVNCAMLITINHMINIINFLN